MAESEADRLKRRMNDLADEFDQRGLMGSKFIRRELQNHEEKEHEASLPGDEDDG